MFGGDAFRGLDTFLLVGGICIVIVFVSLFCLTVYGLWWLVQHVVIV